MEQTSALRLPFLKNMTFSRGMTSAAGGTTRSPVSFSFQVKIKEADHRPLKFRRVGMGALNASADIFSGTPSAV